jgi:hypothetical protein
VRKSKKKSLSKVEEKKLFCREETCHWLGEQGVNFQNAKH